MRFLNFKWITTKPNIYLFMIWSFKYSDTSNRETEEQGALSENWSFFINLTFTVTIAKIWRFKISFWQLQFFKNYPSFKSITISWRTHITLNKVEHACYKEIRILEKRISITKNKDGGTKWYETQLYIKNAMNQSRYKVFLETNNFLVKILITFWNRSTMFTTIYRQRWAMNHSTCVIRK